MTSHDSALAGYHEHCESIGQESFLRIPLGRSWRRLPMSPLVFAVSVLLLAGCASNRGQQKHSSDTPSSTLQMLRAFTSSVLEIRCKMCQQPIQPGDSSLTTTGIV